MLIRYTKLEIPLVLYILLVKGDKSFESGSIKPSPDKNFVYSKKGNKVGKSTVAQTIIEFNATFEYVSGFATMAIKTKKISNDKKKEYITFKLILFLCLTSILVFIIIKYVINKANYDIKVRTT